MCSVPVIAGLGMQTLGDYMGQKGQAQAYQSYMNAQAKAAVTDMNHQLQNFEIQRTDAFDAAVAEITKTRINALGLNSGVVATVNENQQGRTANLLIRGVEGDTARAVASTQDNYQRKSNEIDLNKESKVKTTKSTLENLNASAPKSPSRFANFVNFGANALGAYNTAMNQKNDVLTSGKKFNFWTGGAKKAPKTPKQ